VIDEIIESFEVDDNNNLLFSGFYQMYYMQTVSEPEETLKDFQKRKKNFLLFEIVDLHIYIHYRWLR
jgi:hypothetical protein